ncbi:ATP-binding protein [Verrucomicrobiota bacterium sgz303538]
MQQLQKNRLFAGVSPELISEIGADMNLVRYDRDDIIFREGDPGDCLYLVVEGSVRISKTGRGGQQETLGFIQPGNFFGEMALIDGQPRSAQATASESCTLGHVDNAAFARILEIAPRDLLMNFLRSSTERLRGINAHFISELMRNERVSVVGAMANSIIHDLNNPLFIIQNCIELIDERVPDPAVEKYVNMIRRASGNMGAMTQELLDFARGRSSIQPSRELVTAVFTELDEQISRLVPSNITLVREMESTAEIMVDVGRFARMLLNLVKNAIEAMPQGGMLRLKVSEERERVIFQISDTGCGIDPELQAKIFEPFVTFGKSKGTGLGMAIVKSVVDAHGGTIRLSSTVGEGTTVEVELPVASAE